MQGTTRFAYGCCLALAFALGACARPEPVDLIVSDAAIYTLDPSQPRAEAMAIRAGRIVALGSNREIRARFTGVERAAAGRMVLPGFHDAHVHPVGAGIDLQRCDLSDAASVEALLATLRACAADDPGEHWLIGRGWSLALFPDANPSKALLDRVARDRPILLESEDGHSSWANSAALARAGVDAETADPPLGIIERDSNGEPSGTLRESAEDLLWSLVPEPGPDELESALRNGVRILNGYGITSIVEANAGAAELAAYRAVAAAGELDVRAVLSLGAAADRRAAAPPDPASRDGEARVRTDAVKIFLDGVLEGETAALLEPYERSARGEHRGRLTLPPEELARRVTAYDRDGIQVHVHAIGDRAVRVALDAFAAARRINGPTDNRHHIAHLQLIDPADYGRFAALDVTANFQPVWAFPDTYILNINLPQVGPQRVERMYPIGSLARAGTRIVAGSDWNVTTPNPLVAIEVALTRRDPSGERTAVLNADQAVDLETMLRAYTVNGAWLMHQDADTGRLAPGMLADFVILERNLFEIEPEEIGEVSVVATYLEGELVFGG